MDLMTVDIVKRALPPNLKGNATQDLVDKLNNISTDQQMAEHIRDNFVSYSGVLQDGKFKTEDYLYAVCYVSYKLMGASNEEAYFKTFPQRYQKFLTNGISKKDMSSYVSVYAKGKMVNKIMEQSIVPSWILNQDLYQKALNVQADLMVNANSEKVRSDAANSLLVHLTKPKEVGPLINIDMRENSGMTELTKAISELAQKQIEVIKSGGSVKEVAAHNIMDMEDVTN
jgi:hypothetical protein